MCELQVGYEAANVCRQEVHRQCSCIPWWQRNDAVFQKPYTSY